MKSYYLVLSLVAILLPFGAVQCARCSSENGSEGAAKGNEVPGKALADAHVHEDTAKLEWEQVQLHSSKAAFRKAIAAVLQQDVESVQALMQCGPLAGVWVISPVKKAMVEHESGGNMTFCYLAGHNLQTSSRVSSVRGEFLNDSLVQLQFKFRKGNYDALVAELTSRFGEGDKRELKETALLSEETASFLLWKIKGTTWGIKNGANDVTLYIQDVDMLNKLPVAAKSADSATSPKTDLSDIGIKGSPYDVNLDDLEIPEDTAVGTDSAHEDTSPVDTAASIEK